MPSEPHWPSAPPQLLTLPAALAVVEEQAKRILSHRLHETEFHSLLKAVGRVLASSVTASRDQPPFARVTRDGFAVRAQDITDGAILKVAGRVRAGEPVWGADGQTLGANEAVEVMTGCPLPAGANAVLMVEHILKSPDSETSKAGHRDTVTPQAGRKLREGENVVPQGSEARRGDLLLSPGTRLHPKEIALAASCGLRSLPVFRLPEVAILATGDELREPTIESHKDPDPAASAAGIEPHQIYDANSYSLAALVDRVHAVPSRRPPVADHEEDLMLSIQQGFDAAPLLLIAGGVSMGRYDHVEEVLSRLGAEFFFTGVKIQPGKPVVFGWIPATAERTERLFFGLPGNPVSAMTTFRLFVEPILAALGGEQSWHYRLAEAVLNGEVQPKPGLTRFLPGFLDTGGWNPTVRPIRTQGSGDLAAHARANCDIVVPENSGALNSGDRVRILLR